VPVSKVHTILRDRLVYGLAIHYRDMHVLAGKEKLSVRKLQLVRRKTASSKCPPAIAAQLVIQKGARRDSIRGLCLLWAKQPFLSGKRLYASLELGCYSREKCFMRPKVVDGEAAIPFNSRTPCAGAGIWARQFCRNRRSVGVQVEEVKKQAKLFEQAARWYRLDLARLDRTAPSELRRKLDQIAKSGRRLLKNLGVLDLNEAVDGPGDPEIFDALTLLGEGDSPIVERTRRIARLVEIVEAVAAAAELGRRAEQAAAEADKIGKMLVEEGNSGDMAINDWIAAMMSVYRIITGKEPATSVAGPDRPNQGIAGGPLIRFLAAASRPLKLEPELFEDAWRSRTRTVVKGAPPQD
jgi:hypothetical protein